MMLRKILVFCLSALLLAASGCGKPGGETASSIITGSAASSSASSTTFSGVSGPSMSASSAATPTVSSDPVSGNGEIGLNTTASATSSNPAGVQKERGYIRAFDEKAGVILLDPIEWLGLQDKDRLRELGIPQEDLPSGFYIYNPSEKTESLTLSRRARIILLTQEDGGASVGVLSDRTGLAGRIKKDVENPFEVQVQDGTVIQVTECYVP